MTTPHQAPDAPVLVSTDGRVGVIRLNRPRALNALNLEVMELVVSAAERLDADPGIGAIVVTGSERAFAAGADIREMAGETAESMAVRGAFSRWEALAALDTPTIGAVAGYALGGGCELALLLDLLIAAEGATFGQPGLTLGIIPGMGGSQRLTRAVGKATALDMILTNRFLDAREALAYGLVSRVVPADELEDTALAMARTIAALPAGAVALAKRSVAEAYEAPLAEGLAFERDAFSSLFGSAGQREGMAAFLDKRTPDFHPEDPS